MGISTLSQNFPFSIHVLQKQVERLKPLLEAADDLIPFVARKNLRQQVAEPCVMVIAGRYFERDPKLSQRGVQPFLQFPQIRRCRLFQLTNDGRIRRARWSSARIKHFVPPFLKALSVFLCHSGLFSVIWKQPLAQGWM